MHFKRTLIFLFLPLFLGSCFSLIRPWHRYEHYKHPPAPDYSDTQNWTALPDRKDSADAIPQHSNLKDGQAEARADVFFIHPTTFWDARNWNGDVRNKKLNKATDRSTIREQASVYNGSCKVYAPRYRQATLYSFIDTINGNKALDLAYVDIKAAFTYYLEHYNKGRPIIIASHSQGSWLAIRLLRDFFDTDSILRKRLIVAYIIGGPETDHEYVHIPPCDSAGQIGCYIGWGTFRKRNHFYKVRYSKYLCVNPLTWKRDNVRALKTLNLGGVPVGFNRVDVHVCDAQCHNGQLWIHKPKRGGYIRLLGNYHIVDYGLFYMNIRENVDYRIACYFEQTK
jgi:hypothetical protein